MTTTPPLAGQALEIGLIDKAEALAFAKLSTALKAVSDDGSPFDTGIGIGFSDYWVAISGVEFYITARKSKKQIKKEAQ